MVVEELGGRQGEREHTVQYISSSYHQIDDDISVWAYIVKSYVGNFAMPNLRTHQK